MNIRQFSFLIILGVVFLKAWSVIYGTADLAIWTGQYAVNGVENPEGLLWALLNPIWLGQQGYRVWCFGLDMLMLRVQLGYSRIPKIYLAFSQVISSYAYVGWGHTYQNISIIMFMPFIILSVWAAIVPLAMKLPVWLDWANIRDHALCAARCSPVHGLGNVSTYTMLGFCFLLPFIVRKNLDFWLWADGQKIRIRK